MKKTDLPPRPALEAELAGAPARAAEYEQSDSELWAAVQDALDRSASIPNTVSGDVKDHVVTLRGEVAWNFERAAAEHVVEELAGVISVTNSITLRTTFPSASTT